MAWKGADNFDEDGEVGYFDAGQDVWEVDFQSAFNGDGDMFDAPDPNIMKPKRFGELPLPKSNIEKGQREQRRVSRLSSDAYMALQQQQPEQDRPRNRPTRKLKSFHVSNEESDYHRRKQEEMRAYEELVRKQRLNMTAEQLAHLREQEQISMEHNRQQREMEERRRQREEELKRQRESALKARRAREEALRETQRKLEEIVRMEREEKADELTEEQLIEKQKTILRMERELRAQKEALEAKLGTRTYEPESNEFEVFFEEEEEEKKEQAQGGTKRAIKFIVNPGWGIPSIAPADGTPLQLVQIRKLKYLAHAPQNIDDQRDCVLVVLTSHSFLCVREGQGLRLLFPPCDNNKVMWGPSLAKAWEAMFSLRFDDIGPFYMLGQSEAEAKYWMKMFAPPTLGAEGN